MLYNNKLFLSFSSRYLQDIAGESCGMSLRVAGLLLISWRDVAVRAATSVCDHIMYDVIQGSQRHSACLGAVMQGSRRHFACLGDVIQGSRRHSVCLADVMQGSRRHSVCLGDVIQGSRRHSACRADFSVFDLDRIL